MKALYVAWQDPETRAWHTVGRLTYHNGGYVFVYTHGALTSPRFKYLGRMMDIDKKYFSEQLFPLFANRVMDRSRPEYPEYLSWLGMGPGEADPLCVLGRSGGLRATDNLCVYPLPDLDEHGQTEIFFFSHGVRYLDGRSLDRLLRLQKNERLAFVPEDENPHDRFALVLESEDRLKLGYCPQYLTRDMRRILDSTDVTLTVEKVSTGAPLHFRLLCKAVFQNPEQFDLFAGEEHRPLVESQAAAA